MTTAEMLAEVTAQIRKDIPRLMELREGCVLEIPQFEDPDKVWTYKIVSKRKEGIKFYYDILSLSSYSFDTLSKTDLGKYTIIGKEPMLNDVLEWLQSLNIQIEIQCYSEENTIGFYYVRIDKNCDVHEEMEIWNLSTPYLKDQSEELIKFLYNLKNK